MHIETDLDASHAQRLLELQARTQQPLPELVRQLLSQAIDTLPSAESEGEKVLRILREEKLIGCISGDGSLSETYKPQLWKST